MSPLHPEDGGEDFEDKAAKWKAKTITKTFTNFKEFSIARKTMVRNRDTHKRMKVKDAGFHSANSAREMEDGIYANMESGLRSLPW